MATYQNKSVTVLRDARQGDAGFDASKTSENQSNQPNQPNQSNQVLIKLTDGTQKVVNRSEVTTP